MPDPVSNASFILSTGRVSTQTLATIAKRAYPGALVEHEGLRANYGSRRVFRRPGRFARELGNNIPLQRKLVQIEQRLARGKSYLDVGWPAYAWLPYFAKRFGARLRFAHLVRNPFHVAASHTTHGMFASPTGITRRFQRLGMIHAGDGKLYHRRIAEQAAGFTPFERNLLHWLELNQFASELHDTEGFTGLFRFEDLYGGSDPALPRLLDGLLGPTDMPLEDVLVDRGQKQLPVAIEPAHPDLVEAVMALSLRLGFSEQELNAAYDVDALNTRYGARRHETAARGKA